MIQSININLGGRLFNIDNNAFSLLQNYLDAFERRFKNQTERAEIMADIENRLAELFTQRLVPPKNLIDTNDVNYVINIMGEPDAFGPTDDNSFQLQNIPQRRLYRNPDDKILGGVCSGLASYFDSVAWLFRGLFMLFTFLFFSSIIIYLILWLIIPEAQTAAQKLEMRGKPINIENITESVKREFNNVRRRMNF